MGEDWAQYVTRITSDGLQKDAAYAAGIDSSSISRWKLGKLKQAPDAKKVVAFARAFDRPPVEALVAAGYITEEEAHGVIEVRRSAADFSDDVLARELLGRLDALRRGDHLQPGRHSWGSWVDRDASDTIPRRG